MGQNHYFEIQNLRKNFGGLSAVRDVSFAIAQGKITSLIGPNGAGKTTVFNLVTGLLPLDGGKVRFKGEDITGLSPNQIVAKGIARTFQDLRLFQRMTVLQNVLLGFQRRRGEKLLPALLGGKRLTQEEAADLERARSLLAQVELQGKADELVENLSYGEQKLLSLVRILATDAELLMLDEPASGLPLGEVSRMLQRIQGLVQRGKTVFIVEHNMEAVMGLSDWIIVLNFGEKIAEGTPAEIQRNEKVIQVYLGV
jgi:branched-chain amino acid transport system ATP-binding protein